ncbi:MAG: SGNH/GDSL hydrolase family protein [Planctomycetia bacterium]|nr:MAG: SGNH/GDSL hydrolase family protein [Planctomycetia bacterium]
MKRIRIYLALVLLVLFASSALAAEPRAPLAGLKLEPGTSIVLLGDSITHQCLYTQYVEDYFYTRFPGMRLRLHNAGVSGAKARDALARFDRDVAHYKPAYVTVLLGMNDGLYQPYDQETFSTYHQDMLALVDRLKEIDATPILITPTMYDARAARAAGRDAPERNEFYNSVLAYYGAWLREVAVENGFGFVDMYSPLNNLTLKQRMTNPAFTMLKDAVHPGPGGQAVMAFALVSDLGLQRQVSSIRIVRRRGRPVAKATGGTVQEVEFTDDGVSFRWSADSLPWVLPEAAAVGAKLCGLGHRMSREALEVHGLAAGQYELLIDDQPVGSYRSVALERHIELQSNLKTPQYQQALEVAELNKQRNEGPVRALRSEWLRFQQHDRLQRQAEQNPDNAKLADEVTQAAKQLEGMEDRITAHEQAARELEDQIFQINQPKTRTYQLRRVTAKKTAK